MPIYTRKGDDGKTSLISGAVVDKDSARVRSYGTVDELISSLGIVKIYISRDLENTVHHLQVKLFELAAEIATPAEILADENHPLTKTISKISSADIDEIEQKIDEIERVLPPLKNFIIPGGPRASAFLHFARTVCRRAERELVTLSREEAIRKETVVFLNRDLLFVMARYENKKSGLGETKISREGMTE
ncbi:MAG: cob(I)yrinic acid a,c-diamide adenosyltransferase [Candidatus Hodarchaeales archaeon]